MVMFLGGKQRLKKQILLYRRTKYFKTYSWYQ